jgi:hypothetical protein
MNAVGYFFWLAIQAFEVLVLFPPAWILMIAGGLVALAAGGQVRREHRRRAAIAVVLPLVPPVMILACGVFFAHDASLHAQAPAWPEWMIDGLLIAHLVLTAVLVVLLRGARWLALAVCAATLGYAVGAAIMSTMSVSGIWL